MDLENKRGSIQVSIFLFAIKIINYFRNYVLQTRNFLNYVLSNITFSYYNWNRKYVFSSFLKISEYGTGVAQ